jgi:hypothetical protein
MSNPSASSMGNPGCAGVAAACQHTVEFRPRAHWPHLAWFSGNAACPQPTACRRRLAQNRR